jgi:lipopolysaccharide biosynthesis regulator YciM
MGESTILATMLDMNVETAERSAKAAAAARALLERRPDLRGVHSLADALAESVAAA